MVTTEEVGRVPLFAALDEAEREQLSRVAADISLESGEYAAPQGSQAALFAVLDGRIEPVQRSDGVERVVGVRHPGEIFGEVPITLGTVFPVGFRAAVPSRVLRIEPHDYHAIASGSPDVAKEVGRLASHRISGLRGLQGLAADPPPPRAIVIGHRLDPACTELRRFLDRNQVTFEWLSPDTPAQLQRWDGPAPADQDMPVIRVVGGKTVIRPPLRRVAELLGLGTEPELAVYDVVVVGAGPAGLRRRSTVPQRGCARSLSSGRPLAAKLGRHRGSITTSASPPGSRATSSRAAHSSRRAGWEPRSS